MKTRALIIVAMLAIGLGAKAQIIQMTPQDILNMAAGQLQNFQFDFSNIPQGNVPQQQVPQQQLQQQQSTQQQSAPCTICGGSGTCSVPRSYTDNRYRCQGTGTCKHCVNGIASNPYGGPDHACGVCGGRNQCTYCGGSGRCRSCGGTGKRPY